MCVSSNERGAGRKDSYGGVWPAGGSIPTFLNFWFFQEKRTSPAAMSGTAYFMITQNIYKGMGKTECYFINTPSLTPLSSQASIRYAFIVIVQDSEK